MQDNIIIVPTVSNLELIPGYGSRAKHIAVPRFSIKMLKYKRNTNYAVQWVIGLVLIKSYIDHCNN